MRGNLSTPYTTKLPCLARSSGCISLKVLTSHGPTELQTKLGRMPKIPSRFKPCGLTIRWDNNCRRRYTSATSVAGFVKSISILRFTRLTFLIESEVSNSANFSLPTFLPKPRLWYQTSSVCPASF